MGSGEQRPIYARRRWIVAEIVGACMVVLVMAQALTAMLSQTAFRTLATTTTAERVDLLAREAAGRINTGLRLGKPLAQYFGLERQLGQSLDRLPDLVGAVVLLPSGYELTRIGTPPNIPSGLVQAVVGEPVRASGITAQTERLGSGATVYADERMLIVGVPLSGRASGAEGALLLAVDMSAQAARETAFRQQSLVMLGVTTASAAMLLVLALGWLMPFDMLVRPGARARIWVPLLALVLAQAAYATHAVTSFRAAWLESTRGNVAMLAQGLQADLNRVLDMGIEIHRMRGVDKVLSRLTDSLPVIGAVRLLDDQGRVLASAEASQADLPATAPDHLVMQFPLGATRGDGRTAGMLDIRLNGAVIASGVRERVLDAGTVALVSAVAVFELFLLLAMVIDRYARKERRSGPSVESSVTAAGVASGQVQMVARLARPVMFGFLFAWALPLSFLPVYAGTLPAGMLVLPEDILLALPISAEMLCGLAGALMAGRLTDRRGWQAPVLGGLVLLGLASTLSAVVSSLEGLVLARGLVGLGYGLAWMGLQGYVVAGSLPGSRGGNMAWLFAGLFAGHLSGSAVGAMLADQAGYQAVFLATAIMVCLPLAGMLALAWRTRRATVTESAALPVAVPKPPLPAAPVRRDAARGGLRRLLFSRDFGVLLATSVVPFSIAQVGLLYFALPLYLQEQGVSASGTGRILMLYGLCMIYLGPLIGRVVDRSESKKAFVALGGIIGGAGMAYLYFDNSLAAVALAVFLLAFGSCWAGAAQTAWMLGLPRVQAYGAGGATSVMRAADKFGQMIGPLFVGVLFTVMGIASGLAITGMAYMLAVVAFALIAPAGRMEEGGPGQEGPGQEGPGRERLQSGRSR